MRIYERNQELKVQINYNFSLERDANAGILQGSINQSLLFDLFINGLAFFIQNSTSSNYSDVNNFFISWGGKTSENIYFHPTLR